MSPPYAVSSLGLNLPSVMGQLLQGTNWDTFPCAFCRSQEQGNVSLLSCVTPGMCSHSGLGRGGLLVRFRGCCCRTGARCPALRRLGRAAGAGCVLYPGASQPPVPSGPRGSVWQVEPLAPSAAGCGRRSCCCLPRRGCPGAVAGGGESGAGGCSAAQRVPGHVPACGPSRPKAFHTSEQGVGAVGAAGREAQGAALFQL